MTIKIEVDQRVAEMYCNSFKVKGDVTEDFLTEKIIAHIYDIASVQAAREAEEQAGEIARNEILNLDVKKAEI